MGNFSSSFNRPQFVAKNTANNKPRKGLSRPITILGFDLAKQQILGEHKGVKYAFSVRPEVVARINEAMRKNPNPATANAPAPYIGHLIDERMKGVMPVGSKAVVYNSDVVDSKHESGYKIAVIDRVKRIDRKKSKLLEDAIVTATAKIVKGQTVVSHYQIHDEVSIDINDLEGLEKLAARLDFSSEHYGTTIGEGEEAEKVVHPGVGVRFITAYPTQEIDQFTGTTLHLVAHKTEHYDYVSAPTDEKGQSQKGQGHLLTGEEMMTIREDYIEFVNSDPELQEIRAQVKASQPNKDLVVAVAPYRTMPASANPKNAISAGVFGAPNYDELNKYMKFKPLYQLAFAKTFNDLSQTSFTIGCSSAIKTCIEITADKAVQNEDGTFTPLPNNWVKELFVDGVRGDSLSMIRLPDGSKMKPHERLAAVREDAGVATATPAASENASAYSAAPTRPTAPAAQQARPTPTAPVSQTPAAGNDFDDIFNPESSAPAAEPAATQGDDFDDIFNPTEAAEKPAAAPAPTPTTRAPVRFAARKTQS